MQRDKAVKILKEILEGSSFAPCRSLTLLLHPKNGLSNGYQIQIACKDNVTLHSQIEKIAKNNGLAVSQEGNMLIVYQPKTSKP